MTLLAYQTI